MTTPWGNPQQSQGFKTGEYNGALVLVTVLAYEPQIPTAFGVKDAVRCNITVCYHPTDTMRNGEGYMSVVLFNSAIIGALRNAVGKTIGGQIASEQSRSGNNPKYVIREVADENSVAYLQHYWTQHCKTFGVDEETGAPLPDSNAQASQPATSPQQPPAPPQTPPAAPSTPPGPPAAQSPASPPPPPPNSTPQAPQGPPPF